MIQRYEALGDVISENVVRINQVISIEDALLRFQELLVDESQSHQFHGNPAALSTLLEPVRSLSKLPQSGLSQHPEAAKRKRQLIAALFDDKDQLRPLEELYSNKAELIISSNLTIQDLRQRVSALRRELRECSISLQHLWLQINIAVLLACLMAIGFAILIWRFQYAKGKRLEAEIKLQENAGVVEQLLSKSPKLVWVTSIDKKKVFYVSPAFEAIFGRDRREAYQGARAWMSSIHPEDLERVREAAPLEVKGEYDIEFRIVRPDGAIRWLRDTAVPIFDKAGNMIRLAGIAEDITTRKALEAQLFQAKKMESIGTLAGGIAHDFNNILTAIGGYTELVREHVHKDPRAIEHLREISTATFRAQDLVQQILTFSRGEIIKRTAVDLVTVAEEAFKLVRAGLPKSIHLSSDFCDGPLLIHANTTQIHRTLLNLVTNAAQAIDGQPGNISVTLREQYIDRETAENQAGLTAGHYAMLSVRDNGCGMTDEQQSRMFDPFYTTKPVTSGTGMGMAMVHGIVKGHHGFISVDSQLDEGTTIKILFPLLDNRDDQPAGESSQIGENRHILYVSSPDSHDHSSKIIDSLNHHVHSAGSPEECLQLLADTAYKIDLIIIEQMSVALTFPQCTRLLEKRGIPLIVLGELHSRELPEEAAKTPAHCYFLRKPFTRQHLLAKINEALNPATANPVVGAK